MPARPDGLPSAVCRVDHLKRTVLIDECLSIDPLLFRVVQCILFTLKLCLQPAEDLKVRRLLSGQFALMRGLEVANLRLLLSEIVTRRLKLTLDEVGRIFRLLLAHLEILIDKQMSQFAGNLLRGIGIGRREIYLECVDRVVAVTHQFDVYIFSHPIDFVVRRKLRLALSVVKVQIVDDQEQTRAAENLLRDALQPALQIVIHIGYHIVLWHRRLFDQNQCAGFVASLKKPTGSPHDKPPKKQWYQKLHVATTSNVQHAAKIEWLRCLFFYIF